MGNEVRHQVPLIMLMYKNIRWFRRRGVIVDAPARKCQVYNHVVREQGSNRILKITYSKLITYTQRMSSLILCSTGRKYLLDLIFCYFQNLNSSYYVYKSCNDSISDN